MSDIADFLYACKIGDVVEVGGYIVLAHLLKVVSPELAFVLVRIKRNMSTTIGIAAGVAKPDIITLTRSDECGSNIGPIHEKSVSCIHETMLHEYYWFRAVRDCLTDQSWNAHDCQNITIFCNDGVFLVLKAIFDANFLNGFVAITIDDLCLNNCKQSSTDEGFHNQYLIRNHIK